MPPRIATTAAPPSTNCKALTTAQAYRPQGKPGMKSSGPALGLPEQFDTKNALERRSRRICHDVASDNTLCTAGDPETSR